MQPPARLRLWPRAITHAAAPLQAALALERIDTMAEFSAEVMELGDKFVSLTIAKAVELRDYLKEKYKIEPAGGACELAPVDESNAQKLAHDIGGDGEMVPADAQRRQPK